MENREQGANNVLLSTEDRANGLSVVADSCNNITLSKGGKPIAWFATGLGQETVKAFVELIKARETKTGMQKL